jgi:BASS family bile acid:Na+ symporter
LVIAMVVLNALVIPAVAWGIAKASPMNNQNAPGLVLATLGAGSAASLKAAQLARRADLPLAVSLAVVLQLVNIVAVPLWAGKVLTGASISAWDIVKSLLALVLLPLVVGLFVRARYADHATSWQPELVKAANLALVVAIATGIAANWSTIELLHEESSSDRAADGIRGSVENLREHTADLGVVRGLGLLARHEVGPVEE